MRLGQTALSQQASRAQGTTTLHGAQDLELGVKLALTTQHTLVPESAVMLRLTVPTGSRGVSADAVLPGINYDLSWHMLPERLSIEGVLSVTRARDQAGRLFVRLAQGLTGVYTLTAHLEAFADWYAFYAAGGSWERGDGRWDGSLPAPNAYLLLRGCLFVHYERLSTKGL